MPFRTITAGGAQWRVTPSGFTTVYNRDEFGLIFTRDNAGRVETRVTRYSPAGAKSRDESFAHLTDEQLISLFSQSQPSFTSPEAQYSR